MRHLIDQAAKDALAFLVHNKDAAVFKFVGSGTFPKNACEGSSFFLKYLLELRHGMTDVAVIKGATANSKFHYWVETGALVYDLTVHQFPRINDPVIGEAVNPVAQKFRITEQALATPDFDKADVYALIEGGFI